MAGMLYLLRQWLMPESPALDFGLALLLRTLHVIWGDHAKVRSRTLMNAHVVR